VHGVSSIKLLSNWLLVALRPAPVDLFVAHGEVRLAVDLNVGAGKVAKAYMIAGLKVNGIDLPGDAIA
jgi:hypothetical protein